MVLVRPGRGVGWPLPVVALDHAEVGLLPFERQLGLGQPGQRRGLAQEVGVHLVQHAAHPLEQLGVGELRGQEFGGGRGVGELHPGDLALLHRDLLLDDGQRDLFPTELDVLDGQALLQLPVLLLPLEARPGHPRSARRGRAAWERPLSASPMPPSGFFWAMIDPSPDEDPAGGGEITRGLQVEQLLALVVVRPGGQQAAEVVGLDPGAFGLAVGLLHADAGRCHLEVGLADHGAGDVEIVRGLGAGIGAGVGLLGCGQERRLELGGGRRRGSWPAPPAPRTGIGWAAR